MPFSIEPSPEIWYRDDFGILCNWRKLWRACEVGIDRAEFSCVFLDRWQGHTWWGVDPYEVHHERKYDREFEFLVAANSLSRHSNRARLLRERSVTASGRFRKGDLDFIYIDAAHDYDSVLGDLTAWWPIVSEPGILAGHDFDDQDVHEGVKRAVTEFAKTHGLTVYLTSVPGYGQEVCPSWYVYKSGMPGPDWRRC